MAAQRTLLLCAALLAAAAAVSASSSSALAADLAGRAEQVSSARKLAGYRPIPIDASVVLLFLTDVKGGDSSPCVQMVNRAMEFKGRAINFFVTAYYTANGARVDGLGWKASDKDKSFKPMNSDYVSQWKAGLTVRLAWRRGGGPINSRRRGLMDSPDMHAWHHRL